MIDGGFLSESLKVGMVSFVASKTLKVMGKKDFADIIACVGWLSVGISVITMWNGFANKIIEFHSFISKFSIGTMVEGVKNFFIK